MASFDIHKFNKKRYTFRDTKPISFAKFKNVVINKYGITNIVKSDDILNSITFDDEDYRIITKDIINEVERAASIAIIDEKCASVPFIGCIRKNLVSLNITRNHTNELKFARERMSADEFQDYRKEIVHEEWVKDRDNNNKKRKFTSTKNNNRYKYNKLCNSIGIAYANMFVRSITMLDYVPFDQDVEDAFQRLNNEE
jgi:DNA repair ATPase RecN